MIAAAPHPEQAPPSANLHKLAIAAAMGLACGYAGGLIKQNLHHALLLDAQGRPVLSDFVSFWAAGQQVLHGAASAAYDAQAAHAAEAAAVGHAFRSSLGWSYPPLFLFVAAALASLPYALSFLVWTCATLAAHAATIALVARRNAALLFACAAPWVLTCSLSGQNGFFTAFLLASALLLLEEHAVLAGLCVGLLSYKPQLGILIPFAFAAGGYWRAFAFAVAATAFFNVLAGFAFGFTTFAGFAHAVTGSAATHLAVDGLGWNKLQSPFGFVRASGGNAAAAWIVQSATAAGVALALIALWRSRASFALKAAALAAAIPLATPYVLVYDLPVLSVALAFLYRHREFDRFELLLLAVTIPSVFFVLLLPIPSAVLASLAVAAIVVRRVRKWIAESRSSTHAFAQADQMPVAV